MKKINGIKSVDFKLSAEGHGIVNFNGSASIYSRAAGKYVNNHMLPKMRGIDMMRVKNFEDINDNAVVYVSSNCIRNAIFKSYSYNLKSVTLDNVSDVLSSIVGLVHGYVIAEGSTSLKRKSPLLIEDLVAASETKINYEQFSQSGERNETSIYSKHTVGEVKYTSYGSINIEDLQFMALEDSLGRSCYREILTEEQGVELAEKITQYLKTLDFEDKYAPKAVFSNNYVRVNAICKEGEAGILLNDDAIELIVKEILALIEDIFINKSDADLKVTEVKVDYNSGSAMRIKYHEEDIETEKDENFAVYYEAMPFTAAEYAAKKCEEKKAKKAKK